ncbi:MAG: carbohydrate binding domain-containing protein [Proteobacteria bacterium]|nr:carbohydrate binding domain-containing protein [Pseudomonadota bacterium]
MVRNGNFEQDDDNNGIPDFWQTKGSREIVQELEIGMGQNGGHCAQLTAIKFINGRSDSHFMICQSNISPLTKNKLYKLSFFAKQSGIIAGIISIAIRNTSHNTKDSLNTMFRLPVENDKWQMYSFMFEPKYDCSSKAVLQYWFRQPGILYIDDVVLEEVPSNSRIPNDIVSCEKCKNLILNSGFECGVERWGSTTLTSLGSYGGLDALIGKLDHKNVYHGSNSMKIELSQNSIPIYSFDHPKTFQIKMKNILLGNMGWIQVEKGKPYTLSAYLKADKAGLKVYMGIQNFHSNEVTVETRSVSSDWKRYSMTVIPEVEYCFILVGPDLELINRENGKLWLDNIQFEKGETASAYQPSRMIETGICSDKPGNIFTHDEPVIIDTYIQNTTSENRTIDLKVALYDFWDKKVDEFLIKKKLGPNISTNDKIEIGALQPGFYSIKTNLNGYQNAKKSRLAVLPLCSSIDTIFGINHAYGMNNILGLCKIGGIGWCRTWALKWQDIEPVKNQKDFSVSDKEVNRILSEKMSILGLIPLPSNQWSSEAPRNMNITTTNNAFNRIRMSYAPENKSEFVNYLKDIAKHYSGKIEYWQIFNEPLGYALPRKYGYNTSDYSTWVKIASDTIKEVNPKNKILVGFRGLGYQPIINDFKNIFDDGILDYCDIITVHCYPGITPPEKFEESIKKISSLMKVHGTNKPIWITEHGYYSDDDFALLPPDFNGNAHASPLENEKIQAAYAVRFAVIQRANGVQKIFYHSGKTSRLNTENIEGMFFEYGGEPRKIYSSIAGLTSLVPSDAEFIKEIVANDGVKLYLFGYSNKLILVLWNISNKKKFTLEIKKGNIQSFDIVAKPIVGKMIEITEYPVYIVSNDISADELERQIKIQELL